LFPPCPNEPPVTTPPVLPGGVRWGKAETTVGLLPPVVARLPPVWTPPEDGVPPLLTEEPPLVPPVPATVGDEGELQEAPNTMEETAKKTMRIARCLPRHPVAVRLAELAFSARKAFLGAAQVRPPARDSIKPKRKRRQQVGRPGVVGTRLHPRLRGAVHRERDRFSEVDSSSPANTSAVKQSAVGDYGTLAQRNP